MDARVQPLPQRVVGEYFLQPTEWLEALKGNDMNKATQIFTLAFPHFKEFLLNGVIRCYDEYKKEKTWSLTNANEDMRFCITKPLHAAAVYHSNDILRFLYASGIDVFQVDDWGNNVFHKLIQAASVDTINESRYGETLVHIRNLLSDVEVKQLMLAENSFALRPLEFATFHGCLDIMDRILETKGVYLYKEKRVGYNIVQYFDVSDYEMFDKNIPPRFYCSPMVFLMFMETSRVEKCHAHTVVKSTLPDLLISAKIKMNWPFLCVWFLFRVLYTTLFFAAALNKKWPVLSNVFNDTSSSTGITPICTSQDIEERIELWYTLSILSAIILIHDLVEYVRFRRRYFPRMYAKLRQRNIVTHADFFNATQILTCLSMLGITCCQMLRKQHTDIPITIDHFFFGWVSYGCVWSLLYFFQVLPWMSIYAIAVQRMMADFARFMFIFLLFVGVFTLSFHHVLMGNTAACPKGFENMIESLYSTLLVTVNLVDFRSYDNVDRISIYALHILYVLFVAILLLNFLIGIMSQSFSEVYAQRHLIIRMQRLSLVCSLQLRLAWPMRAIYRKLQTCVYECQEGRLLIKRVRVLDKSNIKM